MTTLVTNSAISNIRPMRGRIVVERAPEEDRIGSILLPEQSRERPHKGTVRSIGNGVTWVNAGDEVQYSASGRPEIIIAGSVCNIITEQDIYGVVE